MSAKAAREERSSPGSDPMISSSGIAQYLNTGTKAERTKRRSMDIVEATPTQHGKEYASPSSDSGPWKTAESTPSRFPHPQRRKALEFATPSPQQKKPSTVESSPMHSPIEHLTAGKQLTERQQMSLLLQLTSNVSSPTGGSAVVSDVCRRKVKVNWKVHKKNERGETPLHVASIKGDLKAVNHLIRQGAEINSQDHAGWTPLHEAANRGHPNVVAKLLKEGADPNASGMDNDSPLHDAAANSHVEIVQILLQNGAVPDRRNMRGEQPLDVATNDSIIQMLKQHSVRYSPTQADESQEIDTTDVWEEGCQPFDESSELETLDTHNDKNPRFDVISPQLSPIKAADTCLVHEDQHSNANGLMSMERQDLTHATDEHSSLDCHNQVESTDLLMALKADDLVCTEEIRLDHTYEQSPPHMSHEQQPSEELCPEAETTPSLKLNSASKLPGWEDGSVEDDPKVTNQSELTDTTQGSLKESHVEEQQLSEALSCCVESSFKDAQEASEPTRESGSECSKEQVSESSTMEASEIQSDKQEQMKVNGKKRILHSWV